MNIEKLYKVVEEDQMNSPISLICSELELQGYRVKLEGLDTSEAELDKDVFIDFENSVQGFQIEIFKNEYPVYRFNVLFTGYHKFIIANLN